MWQYNSNELMHYGTKGMKWGVRKKIDKIGYTTSRGKTLGVTKGNTTLFGENAIGRNRRAAKRHNLKIKKNYETAKAKVEAGKISKSSTEYKQARNARIGNLAGRAVTQYMGFTDSGRGSYYRHRQMGESKAKSALKAVGRQTVTNAQFAAGPVVAAGSLATEKLLRNSGVIK